jgi:hypothetical protein
VSGIISLKIGELVFYNGPPLLNPNDYYRITKYNNGLINFDDLGIVLFCDDFLRIADLYFQESEIEISRISYKFLIKAE